ncbi:hypothetical protein L1281_002018 [Neisseria sp. HSC-16F19]|nr:hypothetical protein [Neisseria sp. HSC-16F19]
MFSLNFPPLKGCLKATLLALLPLAVGNLYAETPKKQWAETPKKQWAVSVQLPTYSRTTINKTVTVNAPPGTTVVYQEGVPVGYPYAVYPAYPNYPVYHAYPPYPYPHAYPRPYSHPPLYADDEPRAIERVRERTRR